MGIFSRKKIKQTYWKHSHMHFWTFPVNIALIHLILIILKRNNLYRSSLLCQPQYARTLKLQIGVTVTSRYVPVHDSENLWYALSCKRECSQDHHKTNKVREHAQL